MSLKLKGKNMRYYPATVHFDDGIYWAEFEQQGFHGVTQADTPEGLTEMLEDLLICIVEDYVELNRLIPEPQFTQSALQQEWVKLPTLIEAKVLLHNTMREQGINKAELARKMGLTPPEVQRLLTIRHATKIDTVERALLTLGKQLSLTLLDVE